MLGGNPVVVHTIDNGEVNTRTWRGDDHPPGARRKMLGRVFALGEKAGTFENNINAEFAMRQIAPGRAPLSP